MKLQGEHLFDGPRERVWEILRDPNALAQALPGTQSLEKVSENEYQGQMHVRIGPVAGLFAGRVVISNEEPPESCTLSVDGKGSAGFANGTGDVHLTDRGDGTTLLQYQGEFQVGGKLAAVGQRLVDTVSKSIIRQGLESLNAALQVGEPSQAETAPAAAAVEARRKEYLCLSTLSVPATRKDTCTGSERADKGRGFGS